MSDKGFEELLKLIKKLLPEGNTLPETTYEAKKGCETQKESRDLKRMLEDYRTLLYPDCK